MGAMRAELGSVGEGARREGRSWVSALSVLALLFMVGVQASMAAVTGAPAVNRTVPKVSPPAVLQFSSPPLDAEFLRTGLFAEPLAPVAKTTAQENQDLANALLAYRDAVREAGATDAVAPLLAFLESHAASAWKPVLQLNLGIFYRQTGHFSKALDIWQAGWADTQALSDPKGRALANAIVARLSQLEAYLGRKELLQPLLDSIGTRPVGGTAAQLLTDSHTGLYDMVYRPEESFRCGPLALMRILKYTESQPSPLALRVLQQAPSTDHGISLNAVADIAARAGMHYQAAFRSPGATMVMPAVAHWKVGHYAAIVNRGSDGRYMVEDTTFGDDIRVSPATLDEESSGYFLVPNGPLPEGWRSVSAEEGERVWGRGDTGQQHDTGANGCCGASGGIGGGTGGGGTSGGGGSSNGSTGPSVDPELASANTSGGGSSSSFNGYTTSAVELEVVGLQLHDAPVGYRPPVGPPVIFDIYYSHRDTQQPTTFSYTNFGPKWTFTWLSYITDSVNSSGSALVYLQGGGNEPYTFSSTSATTAYPGPFSQSILTRTVNKSGASTGFTITFPDGSYRQFDQAMGSQFFMTAMSDPAGNVVTLTYDSKMRVVAITDAIGQVSTISYGLAGNPLVVTKITDPFGRSASFTYNANGQLASITDVLGITSSYAYGQGSDPDFINTLKTPYGTTKFTYGDASTNGNLGSTRFLKTVDALGRTSYVEFDGGIDAGDTSGGSLKNPSLLPSGMYTCNNYMQWRNTFVFDANEYALATATGSLNYSLGRVVHWLHSDDFASAARVIESEKQPLENRVWYNYPGQSPGGCDNSIVFPVSSGDTVVNGASTQPSAIGRVLDNGTTRVQLFEYNSNGNVTQATDPVGRQMTYVYATNGIDRLTSSNTTNGTQLLETRTYNNQHLPLTVTGANGKTAHFEYNEFGEPIRYTDQLGHATTMTYDSSGHLKTVTGPITTSKYSFTYDDVSRVSSATDPAGATLYYTYDAADRPITTTYPDRTTSTLGYTLLDLTASTDRLGQTTHRYYDADRELTSTTDPAGNTVKFGYNLAGKLDSLTDGNGHTTTFGLDTESRVTSKQYPNGKSMSLVYENGLSLIATVTDAIYQTKTYTYNPDNTTATISYSATQATPSVSFKYDPSYRRQISMTDGTGTTTYHYYPVTSNPTLGANQLESVHSPIPGSSGTDILVYTYDALNRVSGYTVNGVAQSIGFDTLGRTTSATNALGTFTYGYSDGTSRVTSVSSTTGPTAEMTYLGPTGDELLEEMKFTTHSGTTSLAQFGYTYNADDNVKSLAVTSPSAQTTSYGYDTANRLVSALIGTGSKPQYAYAYDHASNLTFITPNGMPQGYSYTSTNAISAGTYDANGSPTGLAGNTYKWDGENRVVLFVDANSKTSSNFTYDGLGRLVRVVDSEGGAIKADHSYFWCGATRCLAHDNTKGGSPVSTEYFDQGAIVSGGAYYYVKDRLGSVEELVTTGGSIAAQYTYDPYGNQTTVSGALMSDIGYAGYFHHGVSGLDFALFRAYDPVHARWLNRDPIGETGGINLYGYVSADPVNGIDLRGWSNDSYNSIFSIFNTLSQGAIWVTNNFELDYKLGPLRFLNLDAALGQLYTDLVPGCDTSRSPVQRWLDALSVEFGFLGYAGVAGNIGVQSLEWADSHPDAVLDNPVVAWVFANWWGLDYRSGPPPQTVAPAPSFPQWQQTYR
jgi:RHS repeat-associated protein